MQRRSVSSESTDGLTVDTLSVLVTSSTTDDPGTADPTTDAPTTPDDPAPEASRRRRMALRGRTWCLAAGPEVAVAGVGGVIFGWAVAAPSLWQDEAATLSVSRRPLSHLVGVLYRTDLVHGGYYLLAHLALSLHDSVTSLRMISVVAFALTAVVLVRIGRILGSAGLGITAAALLIASPLASRYAQEARPFALVTLAATASTYALLRALPGRGRSTRGRWLVYAATLVLLGLSNVLALLIAVPHAVIAASIPATGPTGRRQALTGWSRSAAAAGVVLLPFVAATWAQRGQVAWLTRPPLSDLTGFYQEAYDSRVPVLLAVAGAGAALLRWRSELVVRPPGPAGKAFLAGAVWSVAGPVTLWSISQIKPLWDLHYVMFCLPGFALFLAALPWLLLPGARGPGRAGPGRAGPGRARPSARVVVAVALVGLVAVLGLPQQAAYRDPGTGHAENLRGVAEYLRDHALPGDALLFDEDTLRVLVDVYPQDVAGLRNLGQARTALDSDTLFGVSIPAASVPAALAAAPRVWLVSGLFEAPLRAGSLEAAQRAEFGVHYAKRSQAVLSTLGVTLWVRRSG